MRHVLWHDGVVIFAKEQAQKRNDVQWYPPESWSKDKSAYETLLEMMREEATAPPNPTTNNYSVTEYPPFTTKYGLFTPLSDTSERVLFLSISRLLLASKLH